MKNSDWLQEQRRIVAFLDGLPPYTLFGCASGGDLRSERVNALPVPKSFVGGAFGAAVIKTVSVKTGPSELTKRYDCS